MQHGLTGIRGRENRKQGIDLRREHYPGLFSQRRDGSAGNIACRNGFITRTGNDLRFCANGRFQRKG